MDTVFSILAGLGLAAACGFRVFVPLLVASIAVHTGHLQPTAEFAWIGSVPAMITFGVATVLEITAYYVPWLDNTLDTLATPAAVVAGSMMAVSLAADMDPFLRWTVGAVAGGGLAGIVQTGFVALRAFTLSTSGGIANPLVSTTEFGGALVTSALAVVAPWMAIIGLIAVGLLVATALTRRFRTRA